MIGLYDRIRTMKGFSMGMVGLHVAGERPNFRNRPTSVDAIVNFQHLKMTKEQLNDKVRTVG